MMIRMAVADSNKKYMERLMNGLEKYDDLQLFLYTDKESLENALQTKKFDILLFDPSVYEGEIKPDGKTLCVMLVDVTREMPLSCQNFSKIKKYQRISRIYQNVLELYADVCGNGSSVVGENRTRMAAVYSPVGGCGKTTLALATASGLAAQGYRTFYLNLEDIASEDCYLPQSSEKGMSDLLTCLGTETNFAVKLQGLLRTKSDNFFYLNHFNTPNDIYELKEEETEQLLEAVCSTGLFDFVIIDMGISLDRKTVKIFECVDKIILVERADEISACKLKCFFGQAHIMNGYAEKMLGVMNCAAGRGGNPLPDTTIPLVCKIPVMQSINAAQLIATLAGGSVDGLVSALSH